MGGGISMYSASCRIDFIDVFTFTFIIHENSFIILDSIKIFEKIDKEEFTRLKLQ